MNTNPGILGRKIGMTQIFDQDGKSVQVTAIDATPSVVVQIKTEKTDGYNAIQLGYDDRPGRDVPESVMKRIQGARGKYEARYGRETKPLRGHFYKAGETPPKRFVREIRVSAADVANYEVGQTVGMDVFEQGDFVDVVGTSKGRGFTGVVKRYGFRLFPKTHGTHEWRRHGGSIGGCKPRRTIKGQRMPGQHGNARITVQNLRVASLMPEQNVVLIRGAIPGPNGGYIVVRKAIKRVKKSSSG